MPNWAYNKIVIRGKNKDLLNFLNVGLVNSNIPECDSLDEAVKKIPEMVSIEGCTEFGKNDGKLKLTYMEGPHLGTWIPMPDLFLHYDTTNKPDLFPDVVKEQEEKYGAVGWYNYNHKRFGCKWDCELEFEGVDSIFDTGESLLRFYCQTPWNPPEKWLHNLKDMFPELRFFIHGTEESNAYFYIAEIDEDEKEYYMRNEECPEGEDEWEFYSKLEEEVLDEMNDDFEAMIYYP